MTDQQMHERLQAAGARWRDEAAVEPRGFHMPETRSRRGFAHRTAWVISAAAVGVAATAATLTLVQGQGSTPAPTVSSPADLYGTRWSYLKSDVEGPVHYPLRLPRTSRRLYTESFSVYLRILPDGRVEGSDGCNRFHGEVRVHGDQLTVAPIRGLESCRGSLEEISRSVDQLLRGTLTWRVVCNELVLTGPTGVLAYDAPDSAAAHPRCTRR